MRRFKKKINRKVDDALGRVSNLVPEACIDDLSSTNSRTYPPTDSSDNLASQNPPTSTPFPQPCPQAPSPYFSTYHHPHQQYPYPYYQPQHSTEPAPSTYPRQAQTPLLANSRREAKDSLGGTAQVMDQVFNHASAPNPVQQHGLYPQDAARATVHEIEQDHHAMPGPRWSLVQDRKIDIFLSRSISTKPLMSQLRYAMSGLESAVTFSASNVSRYDALGDSVLERVLVGVSRPIDLSRGMQDLNTLAAQVLARDVTLAARTVHDIRNSTVPIFAVSYLPTRSAFQAAAAFPPGTSTWDMDQEHMQQLFTALQTLTGGRRARIWLRDIAKLSYSPGARWERISIVPFTIFTTIVLQDEPKERRHDVLRMVHEQIALICLGVIEVDGQPRDTRESKIWAEEFSSTNITVQFRSGQNSRVTKLLGPMRSVGDAFNTLAARVVNENGFKYEASERSSAEEAKRRESVMSELHMLSVQVMRGDVSHKHAIHIFGFQ